MSLARYFANPRSLTAQYLWRRYPHTPALTRAANRTLSAAPTIRPQAAQYPWGITSYAAPYRLRAAFRDLRLESTAAWHGAHILTQLDDAPYAPALITAFFAEWDHMQGMRGAAADDTLARYCYVLGLFEEVARSARFVLGPLLEPTAPRSIPGLLALPDPACVWDIQQIGALWEARCSALLARPHALFPAFGQGAPDDSHDPLLIGDELMLIKTTATPKIAARWLRELLGYALLDVRDTHNIQTVSLYLARQGVRLAWPVTDFARALAGQASAQFPALRQEFAQVRRMARGNAA